MAGFTGGNAPSNTSPAAPPPKILLAKPGLVTGGTISSKIGRGGGAEDEAASIRSRIPSLGSLSLLSDSWDFNIDRFLPFLTDNTEFTVVGIIGPPGVGKSTIMNEIYGYDGSSPGMLPPFPIQSEDIRAMARHCSVGIEPRISSERIILLDTQPVFSPSVLAEIMRPDGSSTVSVISGKSISAELAHELMSIQVDLLKHGLPDPSALIFSRPQNSNVGSEKEFIDKTSMSEEYMATPIFVHSKVRDQDLNPHNILRTKSALMCYFNTSSFMSNKIGKNHNEQQFSSGVHSSTSNLDVDHEDQMLVVLPFRNKDDSTRDQYESFNLALWKLRDQVLSMNSASFSRTVSERDWLKNCAKIWELLKNSPIVLEYARTLQSSGMFRR